ncbi:ornithine carbamoyltransferase [Desulfosarcina sp. BuS5]|uniref:ornithine carbamoyltransferase n=1 Tax=Desulfosarcina sp. BuS5 TaxID=933262 RepID=UPI0004808B33|nr:ornithine carbamoyltransferase [Desulfosarcina sp. BuS5]WDN88491.1 ornithine carbamoyltransferase [Desulfosarcina sp. BuS5]
MKKDILTLLDLDKEDYEHFFKRSIELKNRYKKGISDFPLKGKTQALIFDKPSTRTRISFETAMSQLGGTTIFLNANETQMSRNEPAKDTARVLSRYLDCLVIRTYGHDLIEKFAEFSSIPVVNALTDLYHPCQVLSDLQTIIEHKGGYENIKIVWLGDGNNVAHSWINAAAVLGLNLVLACPEGYYPDQAILDKAVARQNGSIEILPDPLQAVKQADVIYTDVWASMGQEEDLQARKKIFEKFQVNKELISNAADDVIVMHCLPAHRGEEISADVLEGPNSVVWDQSENKLHMHKAILETLILS